MKPKRYTQTDLEWEKGVQQEQLSLIRRFQCSAQVVCVPMLSVLNAGAQEYCSSLDPVEIAKWFQCLLCAGTKGSMRHTYMHICSYMLTCLHMYMYLHMATYVHVYISIYICTHACTSRHFACPHMCRSTCRCRDVFTQQDMLAHTGRPPSYLPRWHPGMTKWRQQGPMEI